MADLLLADVIAALDADYPAELAEDWDAIGLVCGLPSDRVGKVLFAVDPHPEVVSEAIDWGADLLITHHPLFLTPVSGLSDGWKGAIVHRLIQAGTGLLVAHTNADVADGGVNDALAACLGLKSTKVLDTTTGLGRVGRLDAPCALSEFAERVASQLPRTAGGIRVAGDPSSTVSSVAVCGGAGGGLVDQVRAAGADVYVTADLRHHRVADALCDGGPALIDASHWATEWPWLPKAARRLVDALAGTGTTVETRVSDVVTDPWTQHLPSSN